MGWDGVGPESMRRLLAAVGDQVLGHDRVSGRSLLVQPGVFGLVFCCCRLFEFHTFSTSLFTNLLSKMLAKVATHVYSGTSKPDIADWTNLV